VISGVMLELFNTRLDTSGKLESKCGKSVDTQMLSAPPRSARNRRIGSRLSSPSPSPARVHLDRGAASPHSSGRDPEFSLDLPGFARPGGRTLAKISTRDKVVETGQDTRKWPEPKFRPSLNREASRLGDVRVRRPSFRAQVPETYIGIGYRQKLCASQRMTQHEPFCARPPPGISSGSSAKTATLLEDALSGLLFSSSRGQVSRVSATLRNRKSRKTLMRLEERSSSG
jgi:hypothetical protein